jgi:DNA-binding MarR family transcriptional regulator
MKFLAVIGRNPTFENSCLVNSMPNNHFRRGELYSMINGIASLALARKMQKNFRNEGLEVTIEQWGILCHLWKDDRLSQQELCNRSFKDKPSITRLVDNLEKQSLVTREADANDRRINLVCLTEEGRSLQERTISIANKTMEDALDGVSKDQIETVRKVLQLVYDNVTK